MGMRRCGSAVVLPSFCRWLPVFPWASVQSLEAPIALLRCYVMYYVIGLIRLHTFSLVGHAAGHLYLG